MHAVLCTTCYIPCQPEALNNIFYDGVILFLPGVIFSGTPMIAEPLRVERLQLFFRYIRNIENYSGNQIEKNEMGGACSTYGGKARFTQDFGGAT
jgi:hypothetical protein